MDIKSIPEIQEYIDSLVRKSPLTIRSYVRDIQNFCDILQLKSLADFDAVQTKDINKYFAYTKQEMWSNSTTNQRIVSIKLLYRYLKDNEYISNKAVLKINKLPADTKETRALTESECNKILEAMQNKGTKKRNYVLFAFLLDSGLRKFEYTKLKLSDIKDGNKIFVEGKRGKKAIVFLTENTVRLLEDYINTERRDTLEHYGKENCEYVFVSNTGEQMDRNSFLQSLKLYAKMAGIKDYESVTVHGARHSGLSIFYERTKDIKATARKARHSDPALTAKIYVHQCDEEFAQEVEKNSFKPSYQN